MNIEDTKPIDVLADRVWSGTRWHYPNIEKMVAELTSIRTQLAAAEQQLTTATALLGECEPWIDGNLSMSEGEEWTEESKKTMQSLLARVREATKGKT